MMYSYSGFVLFLIILLSTSSFAVDVDPTNPNGIAAVISEYGDFAHEPSHFILCVDGSVKTLSRAVSPHFEWEAADVFGMTSVPVPVAEIVDWTLLSVTTQSGDIFFYHTYDRQWYSTGVPGNFGPLDCGSASPNTSGSFGGLKTNYR